MAPSLAISLGREAPRRGRKKTRDPEIAGGVWTDFGEEGFGESSFSVGIPVHR